MTVCDEGQNKKNKEKELHIGGQFALNCASANTSE